MTESPYSGSDAQAYMSAVDALVGDRDPLEILDRVYETLSSFFSGVAPARLMTPEREGKWSMRDVVDHMYDVELIYGYRTRMIVTSDAPQFLNMDQDAWVDQHWYRGVSLTELLSALDATRAINVAFLRSLTTDQKQRYGVHSKRGNETVAQLMVRWAGHDLLHYRQLERIWETVKEKR
ncbi:MAG: DinB family protein [candidate division Zixibacteria bacterium]|jgi:hypothetical protein|nr:DinB family protein [candidate division Zixibacteria bacterium]